MEHLLEMIVFRAETTPPDTVPAVYCVPIIEKQVTAVNSPEPVLCKFSKIATRAGTLRWKTLVRLTATAKDVDTTCPTRFDSNKLTAAKFSVK